MHVTCSKGTYIRALARDMAGQLGTVGFVRKLTRTQVGDFYINDALTIAHAAEFLPAAPLKFEKDVYPGRMG